MKFLFDFQTLGRIHFTRISYRLSVSLSRDFRLFLREGGEPRFPSRQEASYQALPSLSTKISNFFREGGKPSESLPSLSTETILPDPALPVKQKFEKFSPRACLPESYAFCIELLRQACCSERCTCRRFLLFHRIFP